MTELLAMFGVACLAFLGANCAAAVPQTGRILLRSGHRTAPGNNHDDAEVAVSTLGEAADQIVIPHVLRSCTPFNCSITLCLPLRVVFDCADTDETTYSSDSWWNWRRLEDRQTSWWNWELGHTASHRVA